MKPNIIRNLIASVFAMLATGGAIADELPSEYAATSNFKMGELYAGSKYESSTWADRELYEANYVELDLLLDGETGNTYAFVPVTGTGVLKPVVMGDLSEKHIASVKVWTDQEMFDTFTPKGVSPAKWEDDGDAWEYDGGRNWYWWGKSIWPAKKVVAGRRWIVVALKQNPDSWAGAKTLRVGIAGTSVVSAPFTVRPDTCLLNPDVSGFTHGMTVSGVECFAPMEDVKEIVWWPFGEDYTNAIQQCEFSNPAQLASGKAMSFRIEVPSAGTLVVAGEEDDEDSLAMKSAFTVSGGNILDDQAVRMSDDQNHEDFLWNLDNYFKNTFSRWVRRISVSGATTLMFTRNDKDDDDTEFNRIYFFPANKKSVAIEAGFATPDANWGRRMTMHGYVTGSGVYTVGETVTLTAIPGEGEAFDHWEEVWGGRSGLTDENMYSPTLSFKVTEDMCGEEWEESQIVVFAVWKPKCAVDALPSIVGAGTVTGTGSYLDGESATLSATPAQGYDFVKWSDGVTAATRKINVVAADVRRVVYACFMRNGDPIDDDDAIESFAPGIKVNIDTELVGYAAKGLPSGLKLNKKTGAITGTPKKPGTYVATFTKNGEETVTMTFVVDPFPTISIAMEGDTEKCKVTGASKPGKGYSVGKKVNLAAKAPKGTAFVGWFMDGMPWPDETKYLSAKQKYVMTEASLSLVARFEREKMYVSCPDLPSSLAVGEEVFVPVDIETQSGVKSVKGSKLPSGLKLKKVGSDWTIVGKPKKAGTYKANVKVTAKSGAVEEVVIVFVVK